MIWSNKLRRELCKLLFGILPFTLLFDILPFQYQSDWHLRIGFAILIEIYSMFLHSLELGALHLQTMNHFQRNSKFKQTSLMLDSEKFERILLPECAYHFITIRVIFICPRFSWNFLILIIFELIFISMTHPNFEDLHLKKWIFYSSKTSLLIRFWSISGALATPYEINMFISF